MPYVAVYGTLKVGGCNYYRWLPDHKPAFCGIAELPYAMFACDEYPMLVPSERKHKIRLEVFEVTTQKLRELDALEKPYGYHRESTRIPEFTNALEVFIYVHPHPAPEGFSFVSSGDWSEA